MKAFKDRDVNSGFSDSMVYCVRLRLGHAKTPPLMMMFITGTHYLPAPSDFQILRILAFM